MTPGMAATLFYMIGFPGAGKTTFAKHLANELKIDHIYGDRIGYELFVRPRFTPEEVQAVQAAMERRVMVGLRRGSSVIYDAMLHSRASRKALTDLAQAHGGQAVGIWVKTPEKVARTRAGVVRSADFANDYKRIVPPELFDRHLQLLELPRPGEQVVEVWGTASFTMQYASFRAQTRVMNVSLQ